MTIPPASDAVPLSADMEYQVVENVGTAWETVILDNTYTAPVPVCTYQTLGPSVRSAVPRVRNIQPSQFELRIQEFTGGSNPTESTTPGTVFCTIADTGVHSLDDGRVIEARTILAPNTAGQSVGWGAANRVNASSLIQTSFTNPVTMTAVVSANDPQPSVVWAYDCENRGNPPFDSGFGDGICVGKHIGQIDETRVPETIGIIIANAGTGVSQGVRYEFLRGGNSIDGVGTNTGTGYSTGFTYDAATVAQMGENGGQGGWATVMSATPFAGNTILISIDEEVVAGDTSRTHIDEEVNAFGYRDERSAALDGDKTGAIWDPAGEGRFALPGEFWAYSLTFSNIGVGAIDSGSIFLVDPLPSDVIFYNGDFDPADGDPAPVRFTSSSSNLRFDSSVDVGFSKGPDAPADMSECDDVPTSTLDSDVRFVCFNPKGAMLSGDPDPSAQIEFRVQIQ